MQSAVNAIHSRKAPLAAKNEALTAWNWAGVVVGGLLLLLASLGAFLPES